MTIHASFRLKVEVATEDVAMWQDVARNSRILCIDQLTTTMWHKMAGAECHIS